LAHELKSPIAASLTELRLLRDLGEELGQSLGHPEVTVEDLRGIVNEAWAHVDGIERAMSRAASFLGMLTERSLHLQVSQRRDFWLHEALEEALRFLRPRLCQASVSVCTQEVSAEIQLHGDPLKLREAITHLLTNAVEALERAGRRGQIRLWTQGRAHEVALWIEDDGPGVPAALRERIFEPLFTSHAAGTGLGLSIARDIMQGLFGGTLELAPGEGGARFVLSMPRQAPHEAPRAAWAPFQHGGAVVGEAACDMVCLHSLHGDSAEEDAAPLEVAKVAQEAVGVELGAVELG
jgi:signal transduction histidine kinase